METRTIRIMRPNDGQFYDFELCCKPGTEFGQVRIDHYWMPVTPLYGQRRQDSSRGNDQRKLLEFFWGCAAADNATDDRNAQERFLLASLVPHVRSEGSRTIFADAFLRRPLRAQQAQDLHDLEVLLHASRHVEMSAEKFFIETRELLGRTEFPRQVEKIHTTLSAGLLDEPCEQLASGNEMLASATVKEKWRRLMRGIGRRRGNETEKIVLNALSYESRTAFHDCYSVAWIHVIHQLRTQGQVNLQTAQFLDFWHTAPIDSSTAQYRFHGHVFGLHPAMGPFVLTPTGRELLGSYLSDPGSHSAYAILRNGLFLAVYQYQECRLRDAARRSAARETSLGDL